MITTDAKTRTEKERGWNGGNGRKKRKEIEKDIMCERESVVGP